jgi:DNA-binding NarL/FixJ family response regulator
VALLHLNLTEMLPRWINAQRNANGVARGGSRRPAIIDLDAIAGAVERSVSTQLSRQLATMVKGDPPGRRQRATSGAMDQTAASGAWLSRREAEVLHMLGEGKTNKEIAKAIARSPNTVKLHVSAILKRLKLKSRKQAALLSSGLNGQQFGA